MARPAARTRQPVLRAAGRPVASQLRPGVARHAMVRSAAANMLGSRLACQQPCPLARRSEAPTVSDPEAPATAGPAEAGGRGRDDSDERRFRDEEERAIASLAAWIAHPHIPPIVTAPTASLPAAT